VSRSFALLAAALLAVPLAASAESPRQGSFELGAGTYRPDVDSDYVFTPDATTPTDRGAPYARVFTGRDWNFRAGVSWALLTWPGSLEAGIRTGFFRASAQALEITNGEITPNRSADKTTFNIIPTSLTLTYRFDLLADRFGVPLAPYGRLALERYNWWITGGSGKRGATNGYSFTGGLAFLLDFFDRGLARELDSDSGINHTYVFADVTKTKVDDFGSKKSWDLSDDRLSWSFGLMFVY
jgi:hypothetical protein